MNGNIYLESTNDPSTASLVLPDELDFTDGQWECALKEVFLPNTQRIKIEPSKAYMLWYLPKDFKDESWIALKSGRKEEIAGTNMIFLEEGMEPLSALPPRDGTEICTYISRYLDRELNYEGRKSSLSYFRGFVNVTVSERLDSDKKVALGFPVFSHEVKEILGMEKDWHQDLSLDNSIIKNFLKSATHESIYSSPNVANIHMMVFFNEIYFNAVGSIVPRIEHKIIRYISNVPTTPRSVYFNFDPPIWCPVQAKKFKDLTVNIKTSSEKKAEFEGGQSLFNIGFRKRYG